MFPFRIGTALKVLFEMDTAVLLVLGFVEGYG